MVNAMAAVETFFTNLRRLNCESLFAMGAVCPFWFEPLFIQQYFALEVER
jgi:hypothetical protein